MDSEFMKTVFVSISFSWMHVDRMAFMENRIKPMQTNNPTANGIDHCNDPLPPPLFFFHFRLSWSEGELRIHLKNLPHWLEQTKIEYVKNKSNLAGTQRPAKCLLFYRISFLFFALYVLLLLLLICRHAHAQHIGFIQISNIWCVELWNTHIHSATYT